jgi:HPt (histidine-containing phosphotransfer) domain-containing protein
MVQLFIDTMPPSLKELQNETAQQNWPQVSKLAHKMKATIDSMGIASLKDDIRTIEANGKKGENPDKIPELVQVVVKVVETCVDQLRADFGF